MSQTKPHTEYLKTPAGHSITARVFTPDDQARAVVVVAPATGVAQYLYDDFAHWLVTQNFAVITFDYDGIGLSIDGHVKSSKSDKLSWAHNDCPAVLSLAESSFPEQKIIWIGHSVGGHMLGMMENTDRIDRAITVAAGTGTWWLNARPTRRVAWFLWYFLVPLLVPVFGYFPGKRLRIMCDLPKGVVMQWRRWCLKKEYAIGAEGSWLRQRFASVSMPITAFAFRDDEMMSMKNINMLHSFFTGTAVEQITVAPEQIDQKRIGHIGWHRSRYQQFWEKFLLPALEA